MWSADDEPAGRLVAVKVVDLSFSGGTVNDFRALTGTTPTEVRRLQSPDGLGLLDEAELDARARSSDPLPISA